VAVLDGVADRVCCGLLPSSQDGWALAVRVLKSEGGIVHVHENIHEDLVESWSRGKLCETFQKLFTREPDARKQGMKVFCTHVEIVKSYAPRVYHIVADLRCTATQ